MDDNSEWLEQERNPILRFISFMGFNWATPVKAWRSSGMIPSSTSESRFNWATPVKAWRCYSHHADSQHV
jgi:hypothetical protein